MNALSEYDEMLLDDGCCLITNLNVRKSLAAIKLMLPPLKTQCVKIYKKHNHSMNVIALKETPLKY